MVLFICVLLCSCAAQGTSSNDSQTSQTKSDLSTTPQISLSSAEKSEVVVTERSGDYSFERYGFKLTFPDNWNNYFIVKYDDKALPEYDVVNVSFYGKSKMYRNYDSNLGIHGRHLFSICNSKYYEEVKGGGVAEIVEIGSVENETYYKFISTDFPMDDLNIELLEKTYESKEVELIKADYENAMLMINQINDIMKTFKTI